MRLQEKDKFPTDNPHPWPDYGPIIWFIHLPAKLSINLYKFQFLISSSKLTVTRKSSLSLRSSSRKLKSFYLKKFFVTANVFISQMLLPWIPKVRSFIPNHMDLVTHSNCSMKFLNQLLPFQYSRNNLNIEILILFVGIHSPFGFYRFMGLAFLVF